MVKSVWKGKPMLADNLHIALKEWAVVQRALLEGYQLLMLRKGGIIEETGDFDLRAEQFLIQPTYAHETERAGDLQPCFGQWLSEEEARRPSEPALRFECACEVVDMVRLISPDTLLALAPQHIWSRQFIEGRFNWEPYKPMTALIVRAYALPAPVMVSYELEYGGCRSWSDLREPISTAVATPALRSDEDFARRAELTRRCW